MAERLLFRPPWSPTLERIADGVWLVRGELRRVMNVLLLEDEGGVTMYDAGVKRMAGAVQMAAERLGGLKRIILGHSHSDHRGTTPYLDAPVYCHPAEVPYAEAEDGWPDYWDHSKLEVAAVRWLYEHYLHLRRWDGEPVDVSGTVEEGDEVCGFRVIHFPGHAPGLIALWRESDRLALVSDLVYFVDSARLKPIDHPVVPHVAFNWDQEMACEAVRKLAELNPTKVCAGHSEPHSEPDLVDQLYRAAEEGLDRRAV